MEEKEGKKDRRKEGRKEGKKKEGKEGPRVVMQYINTSDLA